VLLPIGALLTIVAVERLLPWRPLPRFSSRELPARGLVLFVAAHHDDELVRLVRIRRLQEEGFSVHVAWLASDHYRSSVAVGRSESACAMKLAAVPAHNLHFLSEDLSRAPRSVLARFSQLVGYLGALIKELQPTAIYLNAYEGGHLEHDVAHAATVSAALRVSPEAPIYEFPFYNAGGSRWPYYQVMTLVERPGAAHADYPSLSEFRLLVSAAACFKSQAAHVWGVLASANLHLLSAGLPFRSVAGFDYTARPHPGRLNYEGLEWYVTLTRILPFLGETFARPAGSSHADFAAAVLAASQDERDQGAAVQDAAGDAAQRD
jgi:LmbE family N-acetylglucosaminyl deacetylase